MILSVLCKNITDFYFPPRCVNEKIKTSREANNAK